MIISSSCMSVFVALSPIVARLVDRRGFGGVANQALILRCLSSWEQITDGIAPQIVFPVGSRVVAPWPGRASTGFCGFQGDVRLGAGSPPKTGDTSSETSPTASSSSQGESRPVEVRETAGFSEEKTTQGLQSNPVCVAHGSSEGRLSWRWRVAIDRADFRVRSRRACH
jgi:hypothetical protein